VAVPNRPRAARRHPRRPSAYLRPGQTQAANLAPTIAGGGPPWHELLRRSFDIDREECSTCGGRMKLKGVCKGADSIQRMLRRLGEPTESPRRAPARDPPTYKSRVLRRRAS